MNFLDRFERCCPWIAIPGLIRFVALFNALVFILHLIAPGYESILMLNREAILHGQFWRLLTWIFIPETMNPFWIFFALLFLWFLGDGLENAWGAFRTTLFYLTGMIGCTITALIFGSYGANTFLNLSLLYAFATFYPHYKVLFLFIIPMRIGWLAFICALLTAFGTFGDSHAAQVALLVTFLNYFIYFRMMLVDKIRQLLLWKKAAASRRKKEDSETIESLHCCEICHCTEHNNRDLHFRVTSDGKEYCLEHLPKNN